MNQQVNLLDEVKYVKTNIGCFDFLSSEVINGFSWGKGSGSMVYKKEDVVNIRVNLIKFFNDLNIGKPKDSFNILPEHKDNVVFTDDFDRTTVKQSFFGMSIVCDAMFSNEKNLTITVKPADCATAIIKAIDNEGRKVFGIVHTGWRGVNLELPQKAIRIMCDKYKIEKKSIVIGMVPHIFQKHRTFEYIDNFTNFEKYKEYFAKYGDLWGFDECGCAVDQYIKAGVMPENITVYNVDTYQAMQEGESFSYKYYFDNSKNNSTLVDGRFIVAARLV